MSCLLWKCLEQFRQPKFAWFSIQFAASDRHVASGSNNGCLAELLVHMASMLQTYFLYYWVYTYREPLKCNLDALPWWLGMNQNWKPHAEKHKTPMLLASMSYYSQSQRRNVIGFPPKHTHTHTHTNIWTDDDLDPFTLINCPTITNMCMYQLLFNLMTTRMLRTFCIIVTDHTTCHINCTVVCCVTVGIIIWEWREGKESILW